MTAPRAPTELGLRLRLDDTRPAAVARIAAAFRRGGTLPDCARELDVPLRTLNNWIRDVEGVAEAIEAVRCEAPPAIDSEETV